MAEALRKLRDRVVAEGEAISRRIESSENVKWLKRATAEHRAKVTRERTASRRRKAARAAGPGRPRPHRAG
jgi:hypothetical protein